MPPLVRGRLISSSFAADTLPSLPLFAAPPAEIRLAMERCADAIDTHLGPASSVRRVTDAAVIPLLSSLQLTTAAREDEPSLSRVHTMHGPNRGPLVLVTAWGESLDRAWRTAVHGAIANDLRWCICCNGLALRAVDAKRTWSRDYVEFELAPALREREGQALLWSLLRGSALAGPATALDEAISLSARHGADVCRALGDGVLRGLALLITALNGRRSSVRSVLVFEHSLTALYRVLFLLFAEARGLVPLWHPVYRERYSLDTIVSALLAGRPYRGLWHAVQAISRLAHAGCAAADLKVTAFNGRLFAPPQAATFDRVPIADAVMRDTLLAVSSVAGVSGRARTRIAYQDLDVEQLGSVYEQVLDYECSLDAASPLVRTREVRKSSGAFYTPRALTAFLVSRTLAPLVRGKSSDEILRLRVLDPAMGSGAFLVGACRFLAAAIEEALVAEGRWHVAEVTTLDRALLRREVASRCLYGVDLNPMAVQLARLSLWLATLAADRPLSFLDHRLVAGDSLVGAVPADIHRPAARSPGQPRRLRPPLPLFEDDQLPHSLAEAARVRTLLALEPDDSAAVVRQKERTLASLGAHATPLARWTRVLDLWSATWFWDEGRPPDRGTFGELVQQLLRDRCALPAHSSEALLARAARLAAERRFLHWPLAFPEVFAVGGFDAVIGNPPWDMVRGDSGAGAARDLRQRQARQAIAFFRESGIYVVDGRAHANRYQLFVERALQLLRAGGRLGLVVPSGVVSDTGSAPLRRYLFDRTRVDSIAGMDNRSGIFPIHRSVRFALVTATAGEPTDRISCRFGLTQVDDLDKPGSGGLDISRAMLARLSGNDDLGLPELASDRDLRIVEHVSANVPWLRDSSGWGVQFGRELNATDDRGAFVRRTRPADGRVVIEGKHLDPFRVRLEASQQQLRADSPIGRRIPRRTRLAYREVASATNRLTLIAALVPAHAVTTHSLFCLKTPLALTQQRVLCALLNSFVANYLIRLRVTTHVTATLMSRLPVPFIDLQHPAFACLLRLTETLSTCPDVESAPEYAELQALAAQLYRLSPGDFEHVLGTFPLIPESVRAAAYDRFTRERPVIRAVVFASHDR